MKKLGLCILLWITVFMLSACSKSIEITFILDGEVIETRSLDEPAMLFAMPNPKAEERFFVGWFTDETYQTPYDYTHVVEDDLRLYGKTIEISYGLENHYFSNRLNMPEVGDQTFIDDGLGEVSLKACRDGDTADFTEGDDTFRVRFLGIDTPESGHIYEPWGLAASAYVCEIMENADTIILEFDEGASRRTGTYGRYLAYVWVDGILLNLRMIEAGFTHAQGVGNFKYAFEFRGASDLSENLGLRAQGGKDDPDFPYDAELVETTIEALITGDIEANRLLPVAVEGIVTARIGQHVFLKDIDADYGIFFFLHHNTFDARLSLGNHVKITGAQFNHDSKPLESFFLTNYHNSEIEVIDEGVDFDDYSFDLSTLEQSHSGLIVTAKNLTVTRFDACEQTFFVEDENGFEIAIYQLGAPYIENDIVPGTWKLDFDLLKVGDTINIRAAVSERGNHENMVLLITDPDDVVIID